MDSDIDLLCVYKSRSDKDLTKIHKWADAIEQELSLEYGLPSDTILLTTAEEAELDFVQREAALRIWP